MKAVAALLQYLQAEIYFAIGKNYHLLNYSLREAKRKKGAKRTRRKGDIRFAQKMSHRANGAKRERKLRDKRRKRDKSHRVSREKEGTNLSKQTI